MSVYERLVYGVAEEIKTLIFIPDPSRRRIGPRVVLKVHDIIVDDDSHTHVVSRITPQAAPITNNKEICHDFGGVRDC